tara:strand:+ start:53 stop:562 length:510 start_codon:yes stop_codon:yes gene_type:complete
MIITCINCAKKFDVDSNLIPEKGRLLECNGCNHKWFFNKEIIIEPITPVKIKSPSEDDIKPVIIKKIAVETDKELGSETIELLDSSTKPISMEHKDFTKTKAKDEKNKVKKNYGILAPILVFIISFIALVIIADTFKNPIGKIFPNFEFLLYNLYESIEDFVLFFKDLT